MNRLDTLLDNVNDAMHTPGRKQDLAIIPNLQYWPAFHDPMMWGAVVAVNVMYWTMSLYDLSKPKDSTFD